jgi:ribulose-5-phosphate 4-epimerase/fuculose-1-phosphate aldolase
MTDEAPMNDVLREELDQLALACRILEMEGHGDMTLGHLSLRDPEDRGFWLKRNRAGLGEIMGADDFVLVDWEGRQLEGSGGRHSEWPIHSEILRRRPDVRVVGHTHPFHACVVSGIHGPLLPFTVDADYFTDVPRHDAPVALITRPEEGEAMARSLGDGLALLLANHGIVFCGRSIAQATCVAIFLEKACRAHLAGLASRAPPLPIDPAIRAHRHGQIMTDTHCEHSWAFFRRKLNMIRGDGPIYSR